MLKPDFVQFVENFDIVENALDMRTLMRWNGRDLRNRENLAEHTHLVIACLYKLYYRLLNSFKWNVEIDLGNTVRRALLHDSVELLRGDILSITKDVYPEIRRLIDEEEKEFMNHWCVPVKPVEEDLVVLADLMACYKYIERNLSYPSNDLCIQFYKSTKEKFDKKLKEFKVRYCDKDHEDYDEEFREKQDVTVRLLSGYFDDAGMDVVLDKDVTLMPMHTTTINLNVKFTPKEGEMGFLCSRTSAANKGIVVAMCPIDPYYTGDVLAIVHNISNNIINYKKGESFCQIVCVPIKNYKEDIGAGIKKMGKRTTSNLGGTDNANNS